MADIEKARELLRDILVHTPGSIFRRQVQSALQALDGAEAEEWFAQTNSNGHWCVWQEQSKRRVVQCEDEATAKRIANLPRLEKAAWRVLHSNEQTGPCAYSNLRDALKAGGQ